MLEALVGELVLVGFSLAVLDLFDFFKCVS